MLTDAKVLFRYFVLVTQLFIVFPVAAVSNECPTVGAIRWDAWFGGAKGGVGRVVEETLFDSAFRSRLPFCAALNGVTDISIDCSSRDSLDQDLIFARQAGLSYWAFVDYPDGDPMGGALNNYLISRNRALVNFSVILTPSSLSNRSGNKLSDFRQYAEYVKSPSYQTVLGGRSLFYFLPEGRFLDKEKNLVWLSETISKFRKHFLELGLENPYFVLMYFSPELGANFLKRLGFDALSVYAVHGNGKASPYKYLTLDAHKFWDRAKASGTKFVPTAMAGWDRRPRVIRPVPWEAKQVVRQDEIEYFYQQPKPDELAEHVVEAMHWVNSNSVVAEANTVLVYAWNENDEGGWIIPTLGEADARVRALGTAIRRECKHGN